MSNFMNPLVMSHILTTPQCSKCVKKVVAYSAEFSVNITVKIVSFNIIFIFRVEDAS